MNALRRLLSKLMAIGVMFLVMLGFSCPQQAVADVQLVGNNERLRFYGTQLDGALFDGRSLIGKPTVLWFYTPAPYCSTCYQEAPTLSRVAAANPQVTFVGVAGRWDAMSMQRFVRDFSLNFTNLTDANGQIWEAFFVPWPSAWAFLRPDGDGYLINNVAAPMSEDDLTARVAALTVP